VEANGGAGEEEDGEEEENFNVNKWKTHVSFLHMIDRLGKRSKERQKENMLIIHLCGIGIHLTVSFRSYILWCLW
jgi:hypothetical protein